jgi:hypothetical protein
MLDQTAGLARLGVELVLRHPQAEGERDEPLLGPVGQVPLELPTLAQA